ncbi:hypothetical protein BH23VER1_BH23VER1_22600 [soil metagenome]
MPTSAHPETDRLLNRGFVGLLITQFLGAANDNILKGVLSFGVAVGGIWAGQLPAGGQAVVGLCFTVPFILFSGVGGQIADRVSKQRVTLVVKAAEVGIAAVGLFGFLAGNLWVGLLAMLLLAIQSAFFGPAKYGMIPELVGHARLSQANGAINMLTNIAVIAGTFLAGKLYDLYHPAAAGTPDLVPDLTAPGLALLVVAALGLASALLIPRLRPMAPHLKIDWNLFRPYVGSVRDMAKSSLIVVALAWAFFYLVGFMSLLVLPDYRHLLDISATRASYLLGVLAIAIGLGSVSAGLISGRHIEPRLIPVGAVGMTTFFFLLGSVPPTYGSVATLLAGAGIFAGLYIVPLQALLQHLSPDHERGRFLGTANALSFVASTLGSLVFWVARSPLDIPSNRVFLICGTLSVLGTGVLLWFMRRLIADPSVRGTNVTP